MIWHAQNQNILIKPNKKRRDFSENRAVAKKKLTAATKPSGKFSYKIVSHLRSIRIGKVMLFLLDFFYGTENKYSLFEFFLKLLNLY